ncbi:6720_t:CDS:10 [Ambispora gerdemannii]|uniref:6720_t:CDS:1 n=1 Tax=Ambispora gerdemannii TaxID=144530 RepID=A0A9N8UWH1_9GLOM|nr:6720_t:CDS:10 [Ambispora gerdemannii]
MAASLYKTDSGRMFHAGTIAIITVGLPARGKTHVSRSLCRYLRWLGVQTKVFSVGNYRRHVMGTPKRLPRDFFSPGNQDTAEQRNIIANACLQGMIEWFKKGGQVGIYDASNTTERRRREIHETLIKHDVHPVFIESICEKPEIIESNIRSVKISSPDYLGWDPEEAVKDYWERINNHMPYYETINDPSLDFVKLVNVGEQIIVNNVNGYLQSGECLNEEASQKTDAGLSPCGREYAERLKNFILNLREREKQERREQGWGDEEERQLIVWSSARQQCLQTAQPFAEAGFTVSPRTLMGEINLGEADGLSNEELKEKFPKEYARQQQNPYHHRYPRAESYHDLAVRLEAVILELEREKNDVLIIAHETVLRCLYAYLFDRPEEEIPTLAIPRDDLIEVIPSAYGCKEKRVKIFENSELNLNSNIFNIQAQPQQQYEGTPENNEQVLIPRQNGDKSKRCENNIDSTTITNEKVPLGVSMLNGQKRLNEDKKHQQTDVLYASGNNNEERQTPNYIEKKKTNMISNSSSNDGGCCGFINVQIEKMCANTGDLKGGGGE